MWDPDVYLRFESPRLGAAVELAERVLVSDPRVVVDLGCGTGNVTGRLAERWPSARVVGVDRSEEMLSVARGSSARVEWVLADVATWEPEGEVDVLFSNAALHWLPDHGTLFPRLAGFVAEGGVLAVQMPASHGLPSHRLMRETLAEERLGSEALRAALARPPVEDAAFYVEVLTAAGLTVEAWERDELHALEGDEPVLEWVRGTGLRPVLEGLGDRERERFLTEYRRRLREAYPRGGDGTTAYAFRRLYVVATRGVAGRRAVTRPFT